MNAREILRAPRIPARVRVHPGVAVQFARWPATALWPDPHTGPFILHPQLAARQDALLRADHTQETAR